MFGKNCSRCGLYFLGSRLADEHCPWCVRIAGETDIRLAFVPKEQHELDQHDTLPARERVGSEAQRPLPPRAVELVA